MDVPGYIKDNSDQIILSIVSLIVSIVASLSIAVYGPASKELALLTFFGIMGLMILLALFFNLKSIFDQRFDRVHNILIDYFGYAAQVNDYYRRKQHFVIEKQIIARKLIERCLPNLIVNLPNNNEIEKINIILDSGTTIAEVFPLLASPELSTTEYRDKLEFYTNNLAGIIELHRLGITKDTDIMDSQINIVAGHPLHDYQAVTGIQSEKAISEISKNNEKQVTIGIVTGNWFMAGTGLKTLSICARGEGHLDFKRTVIGHSDYVIVVAPLAKIIRIDDIAFLNKIMPYKDKYQEYRIPDSKKNKVILLTTFRQKGSVSPLTAITETLKHIRSANNANNYTICDETSEYLIQGTPKEVWQIEFPHEYVRNHVPELYSV